METSEQAPTKTKYKWDVFLSHATPDKPAVEKIFAQLVDAGLRPYLDEWHLLAGEPWQEALEDALESSACCAVFLGPAGLGPWQNEEMRTALQTRVGDRSRRVIPVILPGADPRDRKLVPAFLRRLRWVDFRSEVDVDLSFRRLVSGITGIPLEPILQARTDAIRRLVELLTEGGSQRRIYACRQLGYLQDPEISQTLAARWPLERDPTVRYWFAIAIADAGGPDAVDILRRMAAEENNNFALTGILDALAQLGVRDLGT